MAAAEPAAGKLAAFISGKQLKVMSAAVSAIARIGKSVFLDASNEGIMLRALNDGSSVYLSFCFEPEFFKHFAAPVATRDGVPSIRCKLPVKAIQPVLAGIRNVDSTRIALATNERTPYIVFQHQCTSGAVKTHALMYEDAEVFAAVFDRSTTAHSFAVSCRTMETALDHLGDAQEVQIEVTNDGVSIRAHHYGPPLGGKASFREDLTTRAHLESSVSIEADDLDLLSLSLDAEGLETDADGNPVVSFVTTLKEIRAVVDFCRSPAVDIAKLIFYFDSILGSPILLSSGKSDDLGMVVDQVMATICDEDAPAASSSKRSKAAKPPSSSRRV